MISANRKFNYDLIIAVKEVFSEYNTFLNEQTHERKPILKCFSIVDKNLLIFSGFKFLAGFNISK